MRVWRGVRIILSSRQAMPIVLNGLQADVQQVHEVIWIKCCCDGVCYAGVREKTSRGHASKHREAQAGCTVQVLRRSHQEGVLPSLRERGLSLGVCTDRTVKRMGLEAQIAREGHGRMARAAMCSRRTPAEQSLKCECSSVGRASAFQADCRGFESPHSLQQIQWGVSSIVNSRTLLAG